MSDITNDSQNNKKKALGRGLGSLLGGPSGASANPLNQNMQVESSKSLAASASVSTNTQSAPAAVAPVDPESKVWKVAIDKLQSGEYQPRQHFDKEALQELAQSIRENGILQPIVARRTKSGKLEIIAGERRWRASQLAGLHEVPVLLRDYDDKQALELAIVENIQREDLNPIEEAEGYSRLISEFKLSQQQVAEKVGRDRATVANAVRLLSLPEQVKEMISANDLSVGHAKVLLSLQDMRKQIELAKKVVNEKIAVRKLEKLVQSANKGEELEVPSVASANAVKDRLVASMAEELQKLLGTKVSIDYSDAKGKISIHFYSDDELSNIADRLKEACQ